MQDRTIQSESLLVRNLSKDGVPAYTGLTPLDVRSKIITERRFELHMEDQRWFDLFRTGLAYTTMQPFGMKTYNNVFPIPPAQMEVVNKTDIFPQNEGYLT